MTNRQKLTAIILVLATVLGGSSISAQGRWDAHTRAQLVSEIETRDTLIGNQERLLNIYRCMFDIDTQLVPGGCSDGKPSSDQDKPAPAAQIGEWLYFEAENVDGAIQGYYITGRNAGGSENNHPPFFYLRCYANGTTFDLLISTDYYLPGGDTGNDVRVDWRVSGQRAPTRETWYSDEEPSSNVGLFSGEAKALFSAMYEAGSGTLYISVIDNLHDSTEFSFEIAEVRGVIDALRGQCPIP